MDDKELQNIPGMNLDNKYSTNMPMIPQDNSEIQKEMQKTQKELDKFKDWIIKKYKFTQAIGILPPQAIPAFVDEEEVPKETEKYVHLYVIIPEDQYKNIPKIKPEVVKKLEEIQKNLKEKIWVQIKTPVDVFENGFDSKFDLLSAISMSFPLYDTGFLSSLRVAEIHKSLVLKKFEKYVVSYVLVGSVVRGDVTKDSDVDVFLVINDTDVKKMPRLELKERLRSIIMKYLDEAEALAGVKRYTLNVQPYLLTDFWEGVKDAQPVYFTMIRDGVPIYDRGTFMPWKALLKMGKLKPSPEAIDNFMKSGDQTTERAKRALLDILVHDLYWGVSMPSQAMMMLHGLPPPTHKEILQGAFRKVFVEKEKLLEKKYADTVEEIVGLYKKYEHGKLKEISGTEIDRLLKNSEDFIKRLKELRKQVEKKTNEKTIIQVYDDVFNLLKSILGNKSRKETIKEFEKKFVKTGKFTKQHLNMIKNIAEAKDLFKKGKASGEKIEAARKTATVLINDLIEYTQRCELINLDKGRLKIRYKDKGVEKLSELVVLEKESYFIKEDGVFKITNKITESNADELTEAISKQVDKKTVKVDPKVFGFVKDLIGDFELVL